MQRTKQLLNGNLLRQKAEDARFFSLVAAIIISFAVLIRLIQHDHFQAMVDSGLVLFLIAANRILKKDPTHYTLFSRLGLIGGFIDIVLLKLISGDVFGALFWSYSFVVFAFALRDRKEGWLWFALIAWAHLILYFNFTNSLFADFSDFLLFFGSLMLVAVTISWYESVKEKSLVFSYKLNSLLEQRVDERTRQLLDAKRKAEEASRAKSTFLATMSHEIRTPLNAINGFLTLLRQNETDPRKLEYLDIVDSSSKNLLQLLSNILDYTKMESDRFEPETTAFSPCALLGKVGRIYMPKATEKKVTLLVQCDLSLPKLCRGAPQHIRQILENLLSNAVKFTPANGTVVFRSYYRNDRLCFEVKDTGIGIDREMQEHVFDAFTQVDSRSVREYGGSGMGLAVSKKVAESLGGEILLESAPGLGATFTLSIPVEAEEAETAVADETDTPPLPEQANAHVLIVEDSQANQMFIELCLKKAGMTYKIANNGLEGVERFRQEDFDLVLMDENMPKMGGIEAMRKMREIEREKGMPHVPVIAVTANALKGDRERFLAAGMDDYISKPFSPEELVKHILLLLYRKKDLS